MMINNLKSQIESLLLVAGKPVSLKEISNTVGANATLIQTELNKLIEEYKTRGFRIIKKGEKYLLASAQENAEVVAKFLNEELRYDLSPAALETLAIIVYKQPITRAEIESIRGTDCSRILRVLMIRGLIEEVGRKEAPGRPILYGTTVKMLTYLGVENENQLPQMKEVASA
ncbi:SMC-Scp complex subunit ScpB [candidate division WS5 bacterium]|uniref:SMC-Scp complex subunit ScpB n=1 Tax=candidate division WS5 bacterium TaxID=2093353 RepID=A0A419DA50_9BACT|nr:MAG: SMC-Scp complex subunit ScpB [candidate division WS5 bacterium]